jgi:Ser/Thr protein kinase RdoA (MazF antagonist)
MSATKEESELSDEEWRKILKPNPSNEQVIELMKTHFASSPSSAVVLKQELDSYDDRNFWISMDNTDYLVKFHNGVESQNASFAMANDRQDSVIHYQYAIMKALADHGISASRPIFPKNSPAKMLAVKVPVASKDHLPCELIVSVFSWVEGNTMQALKVLPIECLADAGRFLGKIHHAFDKALPMEKVPEAANRHHQWDGKNTTELRQFVHHIQDPCRRAMIENIIETFDKDLIQSGVAATFRTSVNHGDYNDANILINDRFQVTGVIDFGDSTAR